MKLVLFSIAAGSGNAPVKPGVMLEDSVVDISPAVQILSTPQLTMEALIDSFEERRPAIEALASCAARLPMELIKLHPPLPRPRKLINAMGNYWEHAQREARPLNIFLKNPDAVIGPGDTIRLPETTEPWAFMHEAELGVVIKGPVKSVSRAEWRKAVFGYTCTIDVSARGEGRVTWKTTIGTSWIGKSFDTFAPMGPCIVTADEIEEPNDLHVQLWNDGELRHNYSTDDMEHPVPELIEMASMIMTLNSGDVISCGTNHEGLGFIQDGETVKIQIQGIGAMELKVVDPLKRKWDRGVYLGSDATHHAVVKRNRPDAKLGDGTASL
ncbi:fumarylacetoacetate hydrolase family protein [Candidimonas nitroreducens]|uniref:Fumarylacetoacetate hydrolase n=1 Tax=Candidimonas nitroreducens TaxID=683354 RepID=A0A225MG24_9BURK|nr:fumarylacetoacetate hydrolase family protein [Candidimonas nitroreducens]OWT60138.1 fumarylacetoacetate hydrolase [Candidimonas nitroreducens]